MLTVFRLVILTKWSGYRSNRAWELITDKKIESRPQFSCSLILRSALRDPREPRALRFKLYSRGHWPLHRHSQITSIYYAKNEVLRYHYITKNSKSESKSTANHFLNLNKENLLFSLLSFSFSFSFGFSLSLFLSLAISPELILLSPEDAFAAWELSTD
jgi:hypothetical protein